MFRAALSAADIARAQPYLEEVTHAWLRTLTILGMTLVPLFFLLDCIIIPASDRYLLPLFCTYRAFAVVTTGLQYIVISRTRPSKWSYLHGYLFTLCTSGVIILMTVQLGGFASPYYAGLNLVIIAVNMLLPWSARHSIVNGLIPVVIYVGVNVSIGGPYNTSDLSNNLFFMLSTIVIAAAITHLKHQLIHREFDGRQQLRAARDELWGEMEIAKRIQTALLPLDTAMEGYDVGAIMLPADEVGGDYYDIIDMGPRKWFAVGDVSGHGVESGLIMMMTQTSLRTVLVQHPDISPSDLLGRVNTIIKENIQRLQAQRYMTITAFCIEDNNLTFAGKHQDIYIYRHRLGELEVVETDGTWLGIVDDLSSYLPNHTVALEQHDILLLFTDGITEAEAANGELIGEEGLKKAFLTYISHPVPEILSNILRDVTLLSNKQTDDITLLVIKKL